jgi:acyl-coenzyme A thioesterase PaaI-like protein
MVTATDDGIPERGTTDDFLRTDTGVGRDRAHEARSTGTEMTVSSGDSATEPYLRSLALAADPPGSARAAVRLSAALRRLVDTTTGSNADAELLDQVAGEVERLDSRLSPYSEESRYPQSERLGGREGMMISHPVIGPINPFAPRVIMTPSGDELVGSVTYGAAYEGPPGFVHGGHISSGFDAILAMTAGVHGRGGVTKWLHVDFLKPTPLHVEVHYVGTIDERRERSTTVRAELRVGDAVCARGASEQVIRRRG